MKSNMDWYYISNEVPRLVLRLGTLETHGSRDLGADECVDLYTKARTVSYWIYGPDYETARQCYRTLGEPGAGA